MAETYAPSSRAILHQAATPRVMPGYAVQDVDGFWTWDTEGPAEAGVVTDGGFVTLDTGTTESTWRVLVGPSGAPVILN